MVKVVDANIIKVKKDIYRVVRSFVDSSLKESYHWNIGVKMGEEVVFTKMNRWSLTIITNQCTAIITGSDVEIIYKHCSDKLLEIRHRGKVELEVFSMEDVIKTYLVTDAPYATPIPLVDLVEKIQHYLFIACKP